MLLPNPSKGWRSSTSRLLALYSSLFVAWSAILLGVLYWEVTSYLDNLARHSLTQRQQLFSKFEGQALVDALATSMTFDMRAVDAYGLFDEDFRPIAGPITRIPDVLPVDGQIHELSNCIDSDDPGLPQNSCDAVVTRTSDGRFLVLVRENGSLFAVSTLILHALLWGISLTIIPGVAGWHLLRRRPLRRIRAIQASAESIIAGDMAGRLPVSNRRDELDMLAVIVNAMLDRIEKLMNEVKGVCDNIAHDLRTPLTRLRAQLYRIQQQSDYGSVHDAQISQVIAEADTLMARFRGLLRISELEDRQRRSAFVQLELRPLLQELHDFYLPLAEEAQITLLLELKEPIPTLVGDRALLFEALTNLLGNAIKFTPAGGTVMVSAYSCKDGNSPCIDVQDSGPGIRAEERVAVFQRFYRSEAGNEQSGFGLGLSVVAAIVNLHGFNLEIGTSALGGASLKLECRPVRALA
ncbi:HAMP domain-containing histidine kinase [Pseudomonas sp. CDFA 602]|uniref:sensor histidine kinase n=1 Tax=Pseudomonas californiensis TaxID=2829823 RepID=UPI001E2C75AA|nr:HAMP domain-containing sensor histidine kinase [Pseudomonas californiensis]MCD5995490.1 HAMP domain-containing histidine kinase [Pseudomonas californiensis]MCD6001084.1 HAMP domain-containing histidine kinase [Pseudomonas californiensis]